MQIDFWDGFEKQAGVVGSVSRRGLKKVVSSTGEAVAKAKPKTLAEHVQTAKTFGKGLLIGGAVTGAGMSMAHANERANQAAMIPMGGQPGYY